VRTVRIWLLLLLAGLLPVRGAVAAAMLCPVSHSGGQVELRLQHDDLSTPTTHQAMDDSAAGHDHSSAHHDHGGAHHEHDSSGHADKCNLCSACCSLTPMVSSSPMLLAPQDLANVSFPDLSAPAPIFFSDGQERPPRTI
jgi:hypothetical protein